MNHGATSKNTAAQGAVDPSLSSDPGGTETVPSAGLVSHRAAVVRSPDQVWLEFPIAGPTSRIAAYVIDALLLWAGFAALVVLLILTTSLMEIWGRALGSWFGEIAGRLDGDEVAAYYAVAALVLLIVIQAALEVVYFVFFEQMSSGQSPGKRALRLRVLREEGLPVDLRGSLIRNLLRVVDLLPANYFVGFVSMLASPSGKRLGDWAAGTIVVREDRPAPALPWSESEAEPGAAFAVRREHLAHFGATERRLARQTLRRLEALPEEQRELVLERAVEALRTRLGFEDGIQASERAAFLRALLNHRT